MFKTKFEKIRTEVNLDNEDEKMEVRPKGFGYRHFQALLYFTGICASLMIRTNISVGIVAMTDQSSNSIFQTFNWNESTKGFILSSFSWGFALTRIPAGLVIRAFNAKTLFLLSNLISSIFSILTPWISSLGWEYICVLRFITGLAQGLSLPLVYVLLSRWIHPSERGVSSITLSSNIFGIALIMVLSGVILKSNLGWPGIFYASGGFGLFWCLIWFVFGFESPSKHRTISETERNYLMNNKGISTTDKIPVPWSKIFTSAAFLSMFFCTIGHSWGYLILMTEIPSFMAHSLGFDTKSSAFLSAIPYFCLFLLTIPISLLSDYLINQQYLSKDAARKVFNTIGLWIPAVCMVGLGFVTKDNAYIAVVLLVLAISMSGGAYAGIMINVMDLTPNFAGIISGISNGVSNILFSALGPIFVGYVVTDPTNSSQWGIVFFVGAALYFFGNLVFLIYGKATVQDWNEKVPPKADQNESVQ